MLFSEHLAQSTALKLKMNISTASQNRQGTGKAPVRQPTALHTAALLTSQALPPLPAILIF